MSGLVSKWATDETLVVEAIKQDGSRKTDTGAKSEKAPESKWSKPITSGKSKPLESKWATPEVEESVARPAGPKSKDIAHDGFQEVSSRNSRRNNESNTRSKQQEPRHNKPSRNSEHSKYNERKNPDINRGHPKHQESKHNDHSPRQPKLPLTPPVSAEEHSKKPSKGKSDKRSKNVGNRRTSRGGFESENDDDEKLPPMSDAAKAFASRLGLPSKTTPQKEINQDEEEVVEEKKPHSSWVGSNKSLEGNPLAARLGLAADSASPSPKSKSQASPKISTEKYTPPKERRQLQAKALREQELEKQRKAREEKESKAEEDLLQLLDKLDAKELDWASFDD